MKKMLLLLLLTACTLSQREELALVILPPERLSTRSENPDETRISDCNILIYNCFGQLEEQSYIPWREMPADGDVTFHSTLLGAAPYTILAAANLGYQLHPASLEEALSYRHYLPYPDAFSQGMPMAVRLDGVRPSGGRPVTLRLERLMARIDLSIDRTALDADVSFQVQSVRVGGCPRSVCLFTGSKAETADDVFPDGYWKDGISADSLNRDAELGRSLPLSLYLLENRQGDLLENVETDSGKVFAEGRYREVCSYLELRARYRSDSWYSRPGGQLVYRFYLGERRNNFDVQRNTRYRVTVRPEGDGLSEDSWRVDKEALEARQRFVLHPAAYNECQPGDDFRLWCEVLPRGTPLSIEPLAWDDDPDVRQIYDYTTDPDGNGLTLHTKKGGTAVIYFQAGPPVNRDTLAMVVIGP